MNCYAASHTRAIEMFRLHLSDFNIQSAVQRILGSVFVPVGVKSRRLERLLLVSSTVRSFGSSASSSAERVLQREERGADEEETGGRRTGGVQSARAADGPGDELGSPVHLQQVRALP